MYREYTIHKQTYKELEEIYGKSSKTIRKQFDKLWKGVIAEFPYVLEPVNVIFDATFFGRGYGVLVFRAKKSKGTSAKCFV